MTCEGDSAGEQSSVRNVEVYIFLRLGLLHLGFGRDYVSAVVSVVRFIQGSHSAV